MTYLVQILLPAFDNAGKPIATRIRREVRDQLTAHFGGATAYSRAPAKGTWKRGDDTVRDDIIVMEVMTARLDRKWWGAYRRKLELLFRQTNVVVRSQKIEML